MLWMIRFKDLQKRKVTKYIMYIYDFEVLVLYLIVSILCYFILVFHHISEGSIIEFTLLNLFNIF